MPSSAWIGVPASAMVAELDTTTLLLSRQKVLTLWAKHVRFCLTVIDFAAISAKLFLSPYINELWQF